MPAELQAIHRYVLETPVLENVSEEIGTVIENVWPELISKLPPKLCFLPYGLLISSPVSGSGLATTFN
jgi:hypothetical protein